MSEQDELNGPERELELSLKSLAPAVARLDPVAAAFAAGRRSGRRQIHLWQSAAAVFLLASVGLWFAPARNIVPGSPETAGSMVAVRSLPEVPLPLSDQSVLMLQATMRDKGLNALPAADLPNVSTVRRSDLF